MGFYLESLSHWKCHYKYILSTHPPKTLDWRFAWENGYGHRHLANQCAKNNFQHLFGVIHLIRRVRTVDIRTVHILDDSPSPTFEYRIHWNINIGKTIIYKKINSSAGWNKYSGEQY